MFQTNLKGYLYSTVCILKPGKLKHFLWKGKWDLDASIWFQAYNRRELLSLGFDTIASAYLRGDIAVNPSNLFVLDCEAMPVAMDFFYTFGSPCFFHSLMELGINGGKYMPNLWKQIWSSSLASLETLRLVWNDHKSRKDVNSGISDFRVVVYLCIWLYYLISREIKFLILLRWQIHKNKCPCYVPSYKLCCSSYNGCIHMSWDSKVK